MKTDLNPRKRPRQVRAQATYDAIIQAAAQLIGRHGLAGFNTNAVAARAGVSIGSLYQYFPNKDALMVALIDQQQAQQAHSVVSASQNLTDLDLPAAVRLLVRSGMAHHRENALLATAIDHEEARLPVSKIVADYLDESSGLIDALLSGRSDLSSALNARTASQTLPAMVRAIVDIWANMDPPQLQRAEDEAVRAVLGYLLAD